MAQKFFSGSLPTCVIHVICLISLGPAWLAAQQPGGQKAADMVLHNGKILTVDSSFSIAQALAITGQQLSVVLP